MDVGAVLIELKPDRLKQIEDWQQQLQSRTMEAIETLKAEGVWGESWFYVNLEGKDDLIAYMRADDIAKAQQIGRNSHFEIDQVHKQFKIHWFKVHPARLLLDLENDQ